MEQASLFQAAAFEGWDIAFHSGMSAEQDLSAALTAGLPVGVVATRIPLGKRLFGLPRALDQGCKVFVDSGAFTAFTKGDSVDWGRVFSVYEGLIDRTERPENLTIVAPDVIGNQEATLACWDRHKGVITAWIECGARVVLPLQCGELSAGELLNRGIAILGTNRFCAGIPSNLAAMSAEDCATLSHHDFHILGRVEINPQLAEKMHHLTSNNPTAHFSSDATWLRSRLAKIARTRGVKAHMLESTRTASIRELLMQEGYQQRSA
ncbi:hypothetical protein SAMN05216178_6908 [Pseudomonas saponiphila]|jgi:hypothetical protein|uniref:Uncharacterized protein n=2 Tax=Pseudomonas saponiphila TaxID=556534 RepID=A0A1H5A0V7_9PSED|nr:hypothetical protein SAMN05216178_6908 [Pseudomonas saponiphila]